MDGKRGGAIALPRFVLREPRPCIVQHRLNQDGHESLNITQSDQQYLLRLGCGGFVHAARTEPSQIQRDILVAQFFELGG